MADKSRPLRITKNAYAWEVPKGFIFVVMAKRATTWFFRRLKPVFYHPIALVGLTLLLGSYVVTPWLTAALFWATLVWQRVWPHSFHRNVTPRVTSFLAGFRYRYRPRRKLTANGLLDQKDPVPTISDVRKNGCITKVRIKMSHGDEIDYWRERSARLAQTYNAGDCKINPYRRDNFTTFRPDAFLLKPPFIRYHFEEKVTKYRWLELEFLTKDPFNSKIGVEYIDYYHQETLEPVVATFRDGETHTDNLAAHSLSVAMTRWGKSNRIRAKIYAQRHNVADKLLENWMIDGKGGVEGSFLENQIARHAYGDTERADFDPTEFAQLLRNAVAVLKRRQRKMRGFVTEHIPTPSEPWLRIIIDEILVLTSKSIIPEIRTDIAANINLIFQQGIACGVTIDASTQLARKEKLDPIDRDGFTEFEIGRVEKGVVDMVFGPGWWDRGAKCDEIPKDLKGVFYRKTDSTMAPREIRYPRATDADVRALPQCPESVLWPKSEEPGFGGVLIA